MIANSHKRIDYSPLQPALPRRRAVSAGGDAPQDWKTWLALHFPTYTHADFAPRHVALWEWLTTLPPRPKIDLWPRGGAKSATAELGCAWVCARQSRRFVLYVSRTQVQADGHLQAVATLLERLGMDRAVNKYNQSKGWTQQRLRAANGFNLVSFGLDAAMRGLKLDQYRPDMIIFDDIDDRHDTLDATAKKITTITESIIPAGAPDCAILFIQNRMIDTGVAAQLADGTADFLLDRLPATQEPAILDLAYAQRERDDGTVGYVITAGVPTWPGQDLATCQRQMNAWGRRAFLREAQHRTKDDEDGLWSRARDIQPYRVTEPPAYFMRVVVGVDPSATSGGDEAGIIVAGLGRDGHGYILADLSLQGSPHEWAAQVRAAVATYGAESVIAESNNGGEMVSMVIQTGSTPIFVKLIHASRGKRTRAEPVQALAEQGRIHHVGFFPHLEDELCSWQVGDDSPNRLDALVWVITELMLNGPYVPVPSPVRKANRWKNM
jgi:hypothetical protein